jgi:hypothetical protein
MDAAPRTLEVEHHKLTAKLEAAERAAERAALEKSRLQNDAAIQRTQLEEAVAALRRCEAAAKDESARQRHRQPRNVSQRQALCGRPLQPGLRTAHPRASRRRRTLSISPKPNTGMACSLRVTRRVCIRTYIV